ncbi:C-GCAxxG-C-C family protein [Sedimenticola hydrogenitrophicus]|uniref:C-GCAxxG-C-C family protein n=1 Tax=Sedimenticola hydrogenitrophicus TaxID=2967975 RepID=UPI0021A56224|nr:C-GCAxxG-C-C family protein [Sedimenticola hydrogenitrophicus]
MNNTNGLGKAAAAGFEAGLYCAESVLQSVADHYGFDSPLIPRIATGFCSGMARTGGTCGAVSGAILAINLMSGRDGADQSVEPNYAAIRQLVERFRERFDSTMCSELLGCDLGTPEGQEHFTKNELWHRCRDFTSGAADMTADILSPR